MTQIDGVSTAQYEACLGLAWQGLSGCHRLLGLLAEYSPEEIWRATRRRLTEMGVAGSVAAALEQARRCFDVHDAEVLLGRAGSRFVPFGSIWYPPELKHLSLPPAGLFVVGKDEALERSVYVPRVTIVGTRRASGEGLRATEAFSATFTAKGIAVVSGMALGVDGRAHQATLDKEGLTIAVLGCGTDVVYPPRHLRLHQRIAERGLLVSELPPGSGPARWTFPHRNRLLAALGDGVLVIEASKTSGALQTAGWALELGRQVFSVPGSIFLEGYSGCNLLLQQGATPAVEPDAVVEDFLTQTRIERGERRETRACLPAGSAKGPGTAADPVAGTRANRILEALTAGPISMDGLVCLTGLSARELGAGVAELELDGLVKRTGPGIYIRAP
jgi:DNA processing protein